MIWPPVVCPHCGLMITISGSRADYVAVLTSVAAHLRAEHGNEASALRLERIALRVPAL